MSTQEAKASSKPATLDHALECWAVHAPGMWENDEGPEGWWAVSNEEGIVAYFPTESEAFWYRLARINRDLNL